MRRIPGWRDCAQFFTARYSRLALLLFFLATLLVAGVTAPIWLKDPAGFFAGVAVESWGMLLDLLIIGFLITLFDELRQDRSEGQQRIERSRQEIEDFLEWGQMRPSFGLWATSSG
jgi:hypothetical protein